jgi:hypothetical protein
MADEKRAVHEDTGLVEAAPEVGALSLGYEDGRPILILTASGGNAIPGSIVVRNDKGEPVASYTAGGPTPTTRAVGGQEATPARVPLDGRHASMSDQVPSTAHRPAAETRRASFVP